MNKSNYINIILTVFLIGIIIYFNFYNNTNDSSNDSMYKEETLKIIKSLEINNSNLNIKDVIGYMNKDTNNKINLKNIAVNKKLIFYYSEKSCPPCNNYIINSINRIFIEENQRVKIIVFIPENSYNHSYNDQYFRNLTTFHSQHLEIPLELEGVPFLFTLDSSMTINKLHIHNKSFSFLSDIYLEEIKKNI